MKDSLGEIFLAARERTAIDGYKLRTAATVPNLALG